MYAHQLNRGDPHYPECVSERLQGDAPSVLHVVGDSRVLLHVNLGLVCSVSCPGNVVIKTYDAARALRDAGIVVAGGFHSPMERECLDFLLRGTQPVVWCPALGLDSLSLDSQQQEATARGRLVLVSIFNSEAQRATSTLAARRNDFVAAISDAVFVPHAARGGKAEATGGRALARGQSVLTFDDEENAQLLKLGATPVAVPDLVRRARP